jgi:hypothetical protein
VVKGSNPFTPTIDGSLCPWIPVKHHLYMCVHLRAIQRGRSNGTFPLQMIKAGFGGLIFGWLSLVIVFGGGFCYSFLRVF